MIKSVLRHHLVLSSMLPNFIFLIIFDSVGTMSEGMAESLVHNIMDSISDNVSKHKKVSFFDDESSSSVSNKMNKLFGREKPVHHILGGGKCKKAFLPHFLSFHLSRIPALF